MPSIPNERVLQPSPPGMARTHFDDWIFERNLGPWVEIIACISDYNFDPDEHAFDARPVASGSRMPRV